MFIILFSDIQSVILQDLKAHIFNIQILKMTPFKWQIITIYHDLAESKSNSFTYTKQQTSHHKIIHQHYSNTATSPNWRSIQPAASQLLSSQIKTRNRSFIVDNCPLQEIVHSQNHMRHVDFKTNILLSCSVDHCFGLPNGCHRKDNTKDYIERFSSGKCN